MKRRIGWTGLLAITIVIGVLVTPPVTSADECLGYPTLENLEPETTDGTTDGEVTPLCGGGSSPPPPTCSNGLDDDGDGKADYTWDPGCTSPDDTDETDSGGGGDGGGGGGNGYAACMNGWDDDGDGRIDHPDDPGCGGSYDETEADDTPLAACMNGRDDDGDGRIDHPNDPGCGGSYDNDEGDAYTPLAACMNGRDDDGDGRVDHPNDPGCGGSYDNDESNVWPACMNGKDDDGDGKVDHPSDPGCGGSYDEIEGNPEPYYYEGSFESQDMGGPFALTEARPIKGCARVGRSVKFASRLRTHWTFAFAVSFCWDGLTVTNLYSHEYSIEINAFPFPVSVFMGWNGQLTNLLEGAPGNKGTIVRADAKFAYCSAFAGDWGCPETMARFPFIQISLNADGSAYCKTSAQTSYHNCPRHSL